MSMQASSDITFMHGIYNYIPETNHVSTVYSVASVLSVRHVMLLHQHFPQFVRSAQYGCFA